MYVIAHLGYVVRNIEKSTAQFLKEGARLIISPTIDEVQRVSVCLLEIEDGTKIELVSPINKEIASPLESRLKRGGGLDHICYFVKEMQVAMETEIKRGSFLLQKPSFAKAFNSNVSFFMRPSGLVIELMEPV